MQSVIVSSQLSREVFPNNHGGEFTNELNQPIETTKTSVSLSELYFVPYHLVQCQTSNKFDIHKNFWIWRQTACRFDLFNRAWVLCGHVQFG